LTRHKSDLETCCEQEESTAEFLRDPFSFCSPKALARVDCLVSLARGFPAQTAIVFAQSCEQIRAQHDVTISAAFAVT
jgi:hypothetical protein